MPFLYPDFAHPYYPPLWFESLDEPEKRDEDEITDLDEDFDLDIDIDELLDDNKS